jgi:hypothetical protein
VSPLINFLLLHALVQMKSRVVYSVPQLLSSFVLALAQGATEKQRPAVKGLCERILSG